MTFASDVTTMTEGEFAADVIYTPAGEAAVDLRGIFENGFVLGADDGFSGPALREATLTVAAESLPDGAAQGDTAAIGGVAYTVRDIQPDGTGMVHVNLEKTG